MSNEAFDFLTDSPLWSDAQQDAGLAELDDDAIKDELARYREHVLGDLPKVAEGLSIAVSARQGVQTRMRDIKRSVLYFDELVLPDPVFRLTEWTRERLKTPWSRQTAPRDELIGAVRHMKALTPLVRLGRVRFLPTSRVLEAPEQVYLVLSGDAFASRVPAALREWFYRRVNIQRVIVDSTRRMVKGEPPTIDTSSIQVDFGQMGRVAVYDYMHVISVNHDRTLEFAQGPPGDEAAMTAWLEESVNRAAGDFLGDVIADLAVSFRLGCSLVISCPVTAALLDTLANDDFEVDTASQSAIRLKLPMVESASIEQLAELIEHEGPAFNAFRFELRTATERLGEVKDPVERAEAMRTVERKLARDQVHEVERKVREAKRTLKWDIPITIGQLAAGALGLAAGDPTLAILSAGILTGGVTAARSVKEQTKHRLLPGYFLWRLKD